MGNSIEVASTRIGFSRHISIIPTNPALVRNSSNKDGTRDRKMSGIF